MNATRALVAMTVLGVLMVIAVAVSFSPLSICLGLVWGLWAAEYVVDS